MDDNERSVIADGPAARVWDYLSDFQSTNDWVSRRGAQPLVRSGREKFLDRTSAPAPLVASTSQRKAAL